MAVAKTLIFAFVSEWVMSYLPRVIFGRRTAKIYVYYMYVRYLWKLVWKLGVQVSVNVEGDAEEK
jgi:hypothetical protein